MASSVQRQSLWRPASSINHCGVQRQRQLLWRSTSAIVASSASQCGVQCQSLWRLTSCVQRQPLWRPSSSIVASNASRCGVQRQSLWRPGSQANVHTSQLAHKKGVSRKSNPDPSDCKPSAALPLGQIVSFNYNLSG